MASILDRYGIKEVADVTFYRIDEDTGLPAEPVLFLDTLKVSTIEQTGEQSDARGGKGNPKLITWDYGKEITVTLEDALFSPKSMAMIFGTKANAKVAGTVQRTIVARVVEGNPGSDYIDYIVADTYDSVEKGAVRNKVDMKNTTARAGMISWATAGLNVRNVYKETGESILSATGSDGLGLQAISSAVSALGGQKVFLDCEYAVQKSEIVISADKYPGTYYITGDTYARSDVTGKDSFFQFIIPKAKMTSEQTFTLEAEGDPTTFSMNLTVLRPEDGDMMRLVQYDFSEG